MKELFKDTPRRVSEDVSATDTSLAANTIDYVRIDALLADADSAQDELSRRISRVASQQIVEPPSFDWQSYAGADFDPTNTSYSFDFLSQ